MFVNWDQLIEAAKSYRDAQPFDHCVVDDFLDREIAGGLENEFPEFEDSIWHEYDNPLEIKKTANDWNRFPGLTYRVFTYLNSGAFVERLSDLFGVPLFADSGLNGGGWHIHGAGGKLNVHLDYSLHPKLALQRKLNLLIYLNSAWVDEWGGRLGFWGQGPDENRPGDLVRQISPAFNRAVLFDTTQRSWHGLPEPIRCPPGQCRKSIAIYYLTQPPTQGIETRGRALFAAYGDQERDPHIQDLINARASVERAKDVYRAK